MIAPYASVWPGNFQHPTATAGQYYAFFNSVTVPGTYALGLYDADGTLAHVIHNTGTLSKFGDGLIFYIGNGFFGTVITTGQGYSYGSSASFANTYTPTPSDIASYTPPSSTPLTPGQVAMTDITTLSNPSEIGNTLNPRFNGGTLKATTSATHTANISITSNNGTIDQNDLQNIYSGNFTDDSLGANGRLIIANSGTNGIGYVRLTGTNSYSGGTVALNFTEKIAAIGQSGQRISRGFFPQFFFHFPAIRDVSENYDSTLGVAWLVHRADSHGNWKDAPVEGFETFLELPGLPIPKCQFDGALLFRIGGSVASAVKLSVDIYSQNVFLGYAKHSLGGGVDESATALRIDAKDAIAQRRQKVMPALGASLLALAFMSQATVQNDKQATQNKNQANQCKGRNGLYLVFLPDVIEGEFGFCIVGWQAKGLQGGVYGPIVGRDVKAANAEVSGKFSIMRQTQQGGGNLSGNVAVSSGNNDGGN